MANLMKIESIKPKLKPSEIAKELAISTSTLQRYRREIIMHSTNRILQSSNTHTRIQKFSNHAQFDLEVTSNDFKLTSNDLKETSKESVKYK